MDTPKQEVSWLESFPPDIWAYFASNIPGEQLLRLMMTGATILRNLLKSQKVVKDIKLGKCFPIFKSIPRCLNDFPSLEELSVDCHYREWSKSGLTIDLVPSGVRKLVVKEKFQNQLADALFGENATLMLNEHLPHLQTLHLRWLLFTSSAWMTHSPPSLTKLSLNRWDGTVELPTSLVHFTAISVALSIPSFVSKLPPSLESFETHSMEGVDLLVPLLPPSSLKLSLGRNVEYSDGPRSPQNLLEHLPGSLTWLIVPRSPDINFCTNPGLASLLPSSLTELDILPSFPCSTWHLLPQQITKLSLTAPKALYTVASKIVDSQGIHHEVQSVPFDSLPRSLTRLELRSTFHGLCFCGPPQASTRSFFPPHLTHLSMVDAGQLSPETAKLLPSSLTYLEISSLCEKVCEHLPKGLKTLKAFPTLLSPNLIKLLPSSLTTFHSSIYIDSGDWYDYNTGEIIDSISNRPEYSIHENCVSNSFDWKNSSPLPPTLTDFLILGAEELGDSFLLHQQLPNLLVLSLPHSKLFTSLCIPRLPPYLETLNLWHSSEIGGKSFPFLPKHLTSLDLNRSESIFDSDIQHLPRTLKRLYLNRAIHLTELCIPDLPPHLELLSLVSNKNITVSSFPIFPSSRTALKTFI